MNRRDFLRTITAGSIGAVCVPCAAKLFAEPSIQLVSAQDYVMNRIIECGEVLDLGNIPNKGRWMRIPRCWVNVIPMNWFKDASITGDGTSMYKDGRLGIIDRFAIYDDGIADHMSFGTPDGLLCIDRKIPENVTKAEAGRHWPDLPSKETK